MDEKTSLLAIKTCVYLDHYVAAKMLERDGMYIPSDGIAAYSAYSTTFTELERELEKK